MVYIDNQKIKEFNLRGEMNSRIINQPHFETSNIRFVKIKELISPENKFMQDEILK